MMMLTLTQWMISLVMFQYSLDREHHRELHIQKESKTFGGSAPTYKAYLYISCLPGILSANWLECRKSRNQYELDHGNASDSFQFQRFASGWELLRNTSNRICIQLIPLSVTAFSVLGHGDVSRCHLVFEWTNRCYTWEHNFKKYEHWERRQIWRQNSNEYYWTLHFVKNFHNFLVKNLWKISTNLWFFHKFLRKFLWQKTVVHCNCLSFQNRYNYVFTSTSSKHSNQIAFDYNALIWLM